MIIAGTGHRPDKAGGYSEEASEALIKIVMDGILSHDNQDITAIISGMALGWAQALAEAALRLNIPLWCYIPFKRQESVWPMESRLNYQHLLESAQRVIFCSPGLYAPQKMQIRNQRMVDDADLILAYFDGSSGGTRNCIRYAEKVKKPIVNLYPK